MVADVGGELDPDTGIPCYREVVFTVPRQNGKTTLVLGWENQRAIGWEHLGPQRISYSAQTGADARKKLIQDQKPILEPHKKALGIRRIYEAIGSEGVLWNNGSRLVLQNNTEASGHGPSVDLGVKDELFADYDDRRDAALIPAMATREFGQVLACSTAGTEQSVPWNGLVERGRLAVKLDRRTGIAYFEWSASDTDDLDDPATWWTFMPALGYTITEAVVRHAKDTLKAGEFRRAFGNLKTKAEERVLPAALWDAICSPRAQPTRPLTFAVDINPERSAGAIVGASPSVAELIDFHPGIGWIVSRTAELKAKHGPNAWVVVDGTGPARSLIPELKEAGLTVHATNPGELIDACGQLYDGVTERSISLRRHPDLDDAAAAAAKRQVGDAWAWTRKNASGDISPLVAVTLGLWGAANLVTTDVAANVW